MKGEKPGYGNIASDCPFSPLLDNREMYFVYNSIISFCSYESSYLYLLESNAMYIGQITTRDSLRYLTYHRCPKGQIISFGTLLNVTCPINSSLGAF